MSNPIIKIHSWFVACLFLFCQSVLANPQASIQTTETIRWDSSLTLPDINGKPHPGLAGAFSGCIGDFLVIAGGANFPDATPWNGGTKTWWNTLYYKNLNDASSAWKEIKEALPSARAYGVSIPLTDGILCIGGCDAKQCYSEVFAIRMHNGKVEIDKNWPKLPVPLANMTGAKLGNKIFLAGGQEQMKPEAATSHFFMLDLSQPEKGWQTLESWPGKARGYAVSAIQNNGSDDCFYLFSGRNYQPDGAMEVLTDGFVYNPRLKQWKKLSGEFPVMAGTALAVGSHHILFLGGVEKLIPGSDTHPGFSHQVLAYHTITNTQTITAISEVPIAVTTNLVSHGKTHYITSGEIKPGVRTSAILRFEVCPNITAHSLRATVPVLAGEAVNPVGYIQIIQTPGEKTRLTSLAYDLSGTTDLRDIEQISLYACQKNGRIKSADLIAFSEVSSPTGAFRLNIPLEADTSYYGLAVRLKKETSLQHRVLVNCPEITINGKTYPVQGSFKEGLRTGIALRKHRQDGVHTSRIPGLITSKAGTLLAIYDARWESGRDLQGDIDIALNRSEDGGQTWQPMQRILDQHEWGGLPEKYNGVSDACILLDDHTGDLYVAGLWMHGVLDRNTGKWVEGLTQDSTRWIHQWQAKGSQPGLEVKETSQFLITKSTDDGKTWSEPVNITATTKKPEWWLFAPAPGHGITLKDGTLVFPTQGRDKNGLPFSNITYSQDGGKTWKTSNPAYSNTTECMAVQLDNGDIMLNMRDNRNHGVISPNGRRICTTSDLGKTWKEHPTSHAVLTEPTCMASIHKHHYIKDGKPKSVLVFMNPNSYNARNRLTIKFSFDDGQTWPEKYWILLDEWGGAGYSCITSIDGQTLGVVYEGSGANLIFQQIDVKDICR